MSLSIDRVVRKYYYFMSSVLPLRITDLEVQCENPGAPLNGYAQGSTPYRAGDVVQFNCNPEYMMQGQPIIACQDNGRWSGGLPKCEKNSSFKLVIESN